MKKNGLFFTVSIFLIAIFSQGIVYVAAENKKLGFIDKAGKIAIEAKYDQVFPFSEGVALVQIDNEWKLIDKSGSIVNKPVSSYSPPLEYPYPPGQEDDPNPEWIDGKIGYRNKAGQVVIKPEFDDALPFCEGLALVSKTDTNYGYIDRAGKVVIDLQYLTQDIGDFGPMLSSFYEGLAIVCTGEIFDKKCGFIDKTGKFVIQPQFDSISPFSEDLAIFSVNDKYGAIDKSGNIVIKPEFDIMESFFEGLAPVEVGGKWGFIDKTGKVVIKPAYESAKCFSEELAAVRINKQFGFIDKKGNMIIEPKFDYVGSFKEGLAVFGQD